jgi:hypothetical protein
MGTWGSNPAGKSAPERAPKQLGSVLVVGLLAFHAVNGCGGEVTGAAAGTPTGGTGGRLAGGSPTSAGGVVSTMGIGGPSGIGGSPTGTGGSPECTLGMPCAGDGRCVELAPGAYRVCALPVPEATQCNHPGADGCCSSANCATGKCVVGPLPSSLCSGSSPTNSCVTDQCGLNNDCGAGTVCVPAGALGRLAATCLAADCVTDADCTIEPGGHCVPWTGPCSCYPDRLSCVYPGGCASSADCLVSACTMENGKPVCGAPFPPCVA